MRLVFEGRRLSGDKRVKAQGWGKKFFPHPCAFTLILVLSPDKRLPSNTSLTTAQLSAVSQTMTQLSYPCLSFSHTRRLSQQAHCKVRERSGWKDKAVTKMACRLVMWLQFVWSRRVSLLSILPFSLFFPSIFLLPASVVLV